MYTFDSTCQNGHTHLPLLFNITEMTEKIQKKKQASKKNIPIGTVKTGRETISTAKS